MRELKLVSAYVCASLGSTYLALPWMIGHFAKATNGESLNLENLASMNPWITAIMFLAMSGGWMYLGVHCATEDFKNSTPDPKSRKPLPKASPCKLTLVSSNSNIKRVA